jgi:hypothetical protein
MALTQDTLDSNAAEFAQAFNEPDTAAPVQSDDDAFGLTLPPEAEAAADADGTASVDLDGNGDQRDPARGETDPLQSAQTRQQEGGDAASSAADNPSGEGTADSAATPDVVVAVATPDAEPGEQASGAAPADTATDPADEPTDPKDIQRKKSWEGRLKAEETRLKALAAELEAKGQQSGDAPGDATADALEDVAKESSDPELQQAANELGEQVESGEITPEQAMSQLAEDFGQPFVDLISKIVKHVAGSEIGSKIDEKLAGVAGKVDEVISHISNASQREHFKAIAAAHPDFAEVNADPAFDAFVASKGPEAEEVRASGSAEAINALLSEFKESRGGNESAAESAPADGGQPAAQLAPTESASDDEIESASAVRGGGLQLPSEPGSKDDFASAWDDAPDVKHRG